MLSAAASERYETQHFFVPPCTECVCFTPAGLPCWNGEGDLAQGSLWLPKDHGLQLAPIKALLLLLTCCRVQAAACSAGSHKANSTECTNGAQVLM